MAIPFDGEALSWRHEGLTLEVELHREPLNEIGTLALRELENPCALPAFSWRWGAGDGPSLRPGRVSARGRIFASCNAGLMAQKSALDKTAAIAGVSSIAQDAGWHASSSAFHWVFGVLDAVPIATIAAVHGVCFGCGFELALACDRIVADRTARFCFPRVAARARTRVWRYSAARARRRQFGGAGTAAHGSQCRRPPCAPNRPGGGTGGPW